MNMFKEKQMKCPSCPDAVLAMTDRQGIEIDYCPQCRGVWLDRGELDKLLERAAMPGASRHPMAQSRTDLADSDYRGTQRHRPRHKKSWLSEIQD